MIEPVAYIQIKDGKAYSVLRKGTPNDEYTPVYTAEQLHPRVKMTQTQFDEFNSLYSQGLLFSEAMEMLGTQGESERYVNIRNRIYTQYLRENMDSEVIFAQLWQLYTPKYPEETIEIIPDMKWFVRSKEKQDGVYIILANTNPMFVDDFYGIAEDDEEIAFKAPRFDTKEEAELWTNPLTEAVQLPVEGE
ncbi:hypothetical protein [Flyfo myovirus Tbat2_7]|nr:hypothetical protein [Flyfo myovirus Tbat2_7]